MKSNHFLNFSFKGFLKRWDRNWREDDVKFLFRLFDPCREDKIKFVYFKRIFKINSNEQLTLSLQQPNLNYDGIHKTASTTKLCDVEKSKRSSSTSQFFSKCKNDLELNSVILIKSKNENILENKESSFTKTNKEFYERYEKPKKIIKEFDLFIEYLNDVIKNERELEKMKSSLAINDEFNLHFLYKFFEYENQGALSLYDLKYGFNLFGLFPTAYDIKLLIKRYDGSNCMKKNSFFDMVSPVDKEYYRRLNIKPLIDYDRKPGLETLSTVLKESITILLNEIIVAERCYEKWRILFYGTQTFTSKMIFDKIDTFGKNYLSSFDFERNYYIKRILETNKDLRLIFFLFDKNKDQKISYSEFCSELFPKSEFNLNKIKKS